MSEKHAVCGKAKSRHCPGCGTCPGQRHAAACPVVTKTRK